MRGAVQVNRTWNSPPMPEQQVIKRGGGGGNGGIAAHRTMGNMNDHAVLPPPGYGPTEYRRRFFSNVAGLLGFIRPTNMDPTMNRIDGDIAPASPIPWDRRWFAPTYRPHWLNRLYNVYVPNEAINIQRGIVPKVVDTQAKMAQPYPNLLTFYRRYAPYSAQTKVLNR